MEEIHNSKKSHNLQAAELEKLVVSFCLSLRPVNLGEDRILGSKENQGYQCLMTEDREKEKENKFFLHLPF
jgi:hypothetical protein